MLLVACCSLFVRVFLVSVFFYVPLPVRRVMLVVCSCVACCSLCVVCCSLCIVRCSLFVVRCVLLVACCVLFVDRCL